MNKIIILIIGIFVMAGLVYALATFTITGGDLRVSSLQKGLVGHWALDGESYDSNTERITDKTPYENHGTNYGAVLTTDQMGQGNRAMSFDGEDDYVNISDDNSLDLSHTGTISFWSKVDQWQSSSYVCLLKKGAGAGGWCTNSNDPFNIFNHYTSDYIAFSMCNGTGGHNSVSISPRPSVGVWHLYTFTWDGSYLRAFLDGELKGTVVQTLDMEIDDNPLYIGWSTSGYFNGTISDVRIYNLALGADEIDTLYHSYRPKASSGSLQKGLVLDMPLKIKYTKDETAGSEIMIDRTPYSNDGQNYGATVGNDYTSFDGVDDYIDAGDIDTFNPGTGTVTWTAWFKSSAAGISHYIMNFIGGSGYTSNGVLFLEITSSNKLHALTQKQVGGDYYEAYEYSSSTVNDGNWHHGALIWNYSTKTIELFLDGASEGTDTNESITEPPVAQSGRKFSIGVMHYNTGDTNYFNGSISDARIYNRALSPSEIKLLYDKGR